LTELQKKLDDSYSEAVRQNEELNLVRSLFSAGHKLGSQRTDEAETYFKSCLFC